MSDTNTTSASTDVLADRRDSDGNLIDPPVIPEYEQRLTAAANASDQVLIDEVNADYHKARVKLARDEVRRDKERAKRREGVSA
jgi:hypothetical protein